MLFEKSGRHFRVAVHAFGLAHAIAGEECLVAVVASDVVARWTDNWFAQHLCEHFTACRAFSCSCSTRNLCLNQR